MELKDLDDNETLALAALLKFVVLADGRVTPEEQEEIDMLVEELGEDRYRRAIDQVATRFSDEDALKKFLGTIKRQEARELIFGAIFEAALIDAIEGNESEILDWVGKEWDVEVEYDEPAEAAGDE